MTAAEKKGKVYLHLVYSTSPHYIKISHKAAAAVGKVTAVCSRQTPGWILRHKRACARLHYDPKLYIFFKNIYFGIAPYLISQN